MSKAAALREYLAYQIGKRAGTYPYPLSICSMVDEIQREYPGIADLREMSDEDFADTVDHYKIILD